MLDADFQRLLTSLQSLAPAQLAALSRRQGADCFIAAGSWGRGARASNRTGCRVPAACVAGLRPDDRGNRGAVFGRAAVPTLPICIDPKMGFGQWAETLSLQGMQGDVQRVDGHAAGPTPQAGIVGTARRSAARRHQPAQGRSSSRCRSHDRVLLAASLPASGEILESKTLAGTVEVDETYFLRSRKGSRKLERPARKRGGKATKRGLSDEQVPVLIARDRNKATADQILNDRSEQAITGMLGPLVSPDAVLVSDGAQAYRAFTGKARIPHVGLVLSQGERTWGIYHVQNVNAYTSRLKGWMRRFNGVATKYLASYLGWHRMNDREGDTLTPNRIFIAAMG